MLLDIVNSLKNKIKNNYKSITERLISYENNNNKNIKIKRKVEKDKKLKRIKKLYNETRYNEALLEAIKNDIYLFKLNINWRVKQNKYSINWKYYFETKYKIDFYFKKQK